MSDKAQMTKDDAARIQSGQAKGDKDMSSGGFAARAQAAGDKNDNAGTTGDNNAGNNTGTGTGNDGQNKK